MRSVNIGPFIYTVNIYVSRIPNIKGPKLSGKMYFYTNEKVQSMDLIKSGPFTNTVNTYFN